MVEGGMNDFIISIAQLRILCMYSCQVSFKRILKAALKPQKDAIER